MDPAGEWAQAQFGNARLGDVRRVRRAVRIAEAMARDPDASIPKLYDRVYDVQGTYDFYGRAEVVPERLLAGHFRRTREAMSQVPVALLVQDTTTMSYSGRREIKGLAPVGNGKEGLQGFYVHSILAMAWKPEAAPSPRVFGGAALEIIGLAHQHYYVRHKRRGAPEIKKSKRLSRKRESQRWGAGAAQLGQCPEGVRWVHVCDREADIFEFLQSCRSYGHGFVVRACQNRSLSEPVFGETRLFEAIRKASLLGTFQIHLRGRNGEAARDVELSVSAAQIQLRSPWRPGKGLGRTTESCWCVHVWEKGNPELDWILLTDAVCLHFGQALEVALQYTRRWRIEDFHKVVKSGTRAEDLQLENAHRLMAAVAMKSVVALRLLELRERVAANSAAPAETSGLTPLELKILRAKLRREIKTVGEVALAIGRLGGHMNRKADGMPGLQTLQRGWTKLLDLAEGARIITETG